MASSSQAAILLGLEQNNYVSVAIVTCIGYDYILTFSTEVDYIWNKPWTLVSGLFVFVRYVGLLAFMTIVLWGSSFMPGPAEGCFQGRVIGVISLWTMYMFICVADAVMILRVWAIYGRSRLILGILLTFYVGEIAASSIGSVFYSIPENYSVATYQILDLSFCVLGTYSFTWNKVSAISQLTNASVMFLLVISQFVHQSLRMYKATKQWQLNKFINMLTIEGILYFVCILIWNLVNTLFAFGKLPTQGWQILAILIAEYVPFATLTPRFILDVRELYARKVQRGRSTGIDSGFGLSAVSSHGASRTALMFAEVELDESLTLDETMLTEEQTA